MSNSAAETDGWPGDELGLPESGPGSLAPWSRRLLALFIDWGLATLISVTWFNYHPGVTLSLFVFFHIALVGLLGVTIGKRLMRIQVVRFHTDQPATIPGPLWSAVRTCLLLAVIPVLVVSTDGRGLHDRIAGTVQLRM